MDVGDGTSGTSADVPGRWSWGGVGLSFKWQIRARIVFVKKHQGWKRKMGRKREILLKISANRMRCYYWKFGVSIGDVLAAVVWRWWRFWRKKPEVPLTRLSASFCHWRPFHSVEEGKGIIQDHRRRPNSYRLAPIAFWSQKSEMPCACLAAVLVFAPKTSSAPNDSSWDVAHGLLWYPLPSSTPWYWRPCRNDAERRANGISGFCAKNAISAKSQQLGRLGWSCMIPLELLYAMKLTPMPIWRAIDAQLTRHWRIFNFCAKDAIGANWRAGWDFASIFLGMNPWNMWKRMNTS